MSENICKEIEVVDEFSLPLTGCVSEQSTNYIPENIFNIDKESISDIIYNKSKFQKGVDKMSKICGMITALVNVGITPDNALSYISELQLSQQGTDAMIETTRLQSEASVSASKYSLENSQRNII